MDDFTVERIRQSVDFYFAYARPDLYRRTAPLSARFRQARKNGNDPLLRRRRRRPRVIIKTTEVESATARTK